MIESRRCPNATRPSCDDHEPRSSGPRCVIVSRIVSTSAISTRSLALAIPTMPHMNDSLSAPRLTGVNAAEDGRVPHPQLHALDETVDATLPQRDEQHAINEKHRTAPEPHARQPANVTKKLARTFLDVHGDDRIRVVRDVAHDRLVDRNTARLFDVCGDVQHAAHERER